jgi:acyl-CoA thioester hydrolase
LDNWDLPSPHLHVVVAASDDIDGYGHVNNAVYVGWLDATAWSHSTILGVPPEFCFDGRQGMAVWRTQVNYLAPAFAADRLEIATWIVGSDARLRVARRFQIRRATDGRTLLRALIHYVCIDLDSGKPRRMPATFSERYRVLPEVRAALTLEAQPFEPGVEPGRGPSR